MSEQAFDILFAFEHCFKLFWIAEGSSNVSLDAKDILIELVKRRRDGYCAFFSDIVLELLASQTKLAYSPPCPEAPGDDEDGSLGHDPSDLV